MSVLLTARLRMRPMEPRDRDAFVAMNLDPEVMHFFAAPYPPEKSDEHIARYADQLTRDGISLLTLEHRETGQYLGLVGMQIMTIEIPNLRQPAVEIGWRLTREAQGHGYATEAAQSLLRHAFRSFNLAEVVAIIATRNTASQRVAQKLGMTQRPALTFNHPFFAAGDPKAEHLVFSVHNTDLHPVEALADKLAVPLSFEIAFGREQFEEEGVCFQEGAIVLGRELEGFQADMTTWSLKDYRKHWLFELEQVVNVRDRGALVVCMHDPEQPYNISVWPMWREHDTIYFHEQLLFMWEPAKAFDPVTVFTNIGPRKSAREGPPPSEWKVPVSLVRTFIDQQLATQEP